MKPVSVVEVVPPSFIIACYYWKFRKTWCLLKKCISMNPENHWVSNFCLKFLYVGFILLLHFSIFIIMNIQWSKQPHYTWICLWKLHFVVWFCYFWKDEPLLLLNFFISEYLDQIPLWKEMKEALSVKPQTEYRCFCLK